MLFAEEKCEEIAYRKRVCQRIIPTNIRFERFDIRLYVEKVKPVKNTEENQGVPRQELKEKGKGLHTWIFRHDRAWYEEVTSRVKVRKMNTDPVDWEKHDIECLRPAKEAVQSILNKEGKPTRVTPSSVRMTVGARNWFNNPNSAIFARRKEDINDFRIRKIRWQLVK